MRQTSKKPPLPNGLRPLAAPPPPQPVAAPPVTTSSPVGRLSAHSGGLSVTAYRGDGCVLIAIDVDPSQCENLAGFSVARSTDGGRTFTYAPNRLSFEPSHAVYAQTDANTEISQRQTTDVAPYQKFHWVDYPPSIPNGSYTYRVEARYFVPGQDPAANPASALRVGQAVTFPMTLTGDIYPNFRIGFTRGYVSSQAFANRWPNVRALRPDRSVDYPTNTPVPGTDPVTTWHEMYTWLGAHARQLLSEFLLQCEQDGNGYDVFAYDLDEPDFIRVLVRDAQAGRPVRMLLDNAPLHTKQGAMEPEAAKLLTASGVEVRRGHFKRFAHDKCVIERDSAGNAVRVLTGSANFSVRGLYVQSNSVLRIDDSHIAGLYAQAFDEAWDDMSGFPSSEIASQWFPAAAGNGLPSFAVSFAPHQTATVSLDRVAQAIKNAKSSVLFAVMELAGSGEVMQELLTLQQRKDIFSYGVTQTTTGVKFYKSGGANGLLVPFSYLKAHVPEPFRDEWNGGMGQVIHHKFVVVDFNDDNPAVFCGSSNLAEGGEQSNGDNLLEINDPAMAYLYAVEAIQLVDHYEFRSLASTATSKPLALQGPGTQPAWWQSAYDTANIKNTERLLFAR